MGNKQARQDLLPGTLDMLILKSLTRGVMHGYGIVEHIRTLSDELRNLDGRTCDISRFSANRGRIVFDACCELPVTNFLYDGPSCSFACGFNFARGLPGALRQSARFAIGPKNRIDSFAMAMFFGQPEQNVLKVAVVGRECDPTGPRSLLIT